MGFWFIAEVLVLRVESVEPLDPQDRTPAGVTGLASDGYHTGSGHRERSSKLTRSVFVLWIIPAIVNKKNTQIQ
jgi:hypothetical protein